MAARLKARHDDETRQRIKTSQLLNRLHDNAMGKLKVELTSSQVKSIEILLRKTLPDLAAVQLSGPDGGPIEMREYAGYDLARRLAFLLAGGKAEVS